MRSLFFLGSLSAALAFKYDTFSTPRDGIINVHLVPHTHDDGGWLKTVDEYYSGANNSIQHAGVHYVLDSVILHLSRNPDRTFVEVEQAFFQRWWREQDEETRDLARKLVKNGQLEMINGAWVMHDEASPHYLDMIDQTRLGHKFLMDQFGVLPKIGWQIDPFGHSATQAALLSAEVGFTGLFFGRIDDQDRHLRINRSDCEFIWRGSPSLGDSAQVFSGLTGEYGGNYGPPKGFEWNVNENAEPIQDDPELDDYNVQSRIDEFVTVAQWQAEHTRGEHILMTMGSDFQYEAAGIYFSNLDKLIHHANKDGRINVFYSTPERYVAAKAKESVSWPLKTDDFFPYADGDHKFWTGYFTSRPNLKRAVRESSAFFQIAKQLVALGLPQEGFERLQTFAEAMGLLQHHDAVSGTAKQHTTFDYSKRLHAGRVKAETPVFEALAALSSSEADAFSFCIQRNVSRCEATQTVGDDLTVLVWNGLAQARTELMELPVSSASARVLASDGTPVPSQIVPSLSSFTDSAIPSADGAPQTLLFNAELPPLGFATYRLDLQHDVAPVQTIKESLDDVLLENEHLKITFCGETGRICSIENKEDGVQIEARQDWFWYLSSDGNNSESSQPSGAYIFRPNKTSADAVFDGRPTVTLVSGDLADEVTQTFGDVVSQRVRLARGERHFEITYTITNLPIEDGWGKEIVSRISTSIDNDGTCFTDSNGREMLERKRDFRPTWDLNQTEPVAGNYYPVGTALSIRDSSAQLTVLTDAVQAGTGSVLDGAVEMMAHRRLLHDDHRGVTEPLNETEFVQPYFGGHSNHWGEHYGAQAAVRGRYFVLLAPPSRAAAAWRPLQDRLYIPAAPFFIAGGTATGVSSLSTLTRALPANVQLVTLEPIEAGTVLVRLAHQFGLGEDAELSQPASVDLAVLFANRRIVAAKEMALTGTAPRSEVEARRVNWNVDGEDAAVGEAVPVPPLTNSWVTLGPLQVRTFEVTLALPESSVYV